MNTPEQSGEENQSGKSSIDYAEMFQEANPGAGEDPQTAEATAEQRTIPPEAQRIYDVVAAYHDTIQKAYGEDIATLGAESDAWYAAADIAAEIEKNPGTSLTKSEQNLLQAVEAHSATFKATMSFTPEQNGTLNDLDAISVSTVIDGMARERRARWDATTDEQERATLQREMAELRDYKDMLANDEAKFDVVDIDNAVEVYKDGDADSALEDQAENDTKANLYFAKYAAEITTSATPEKADEHEPLSRSEQIAKLRAEEMHNVYDNPDTLVAEVTATTEAFNADWLEKMREQAAATPSEENQRNLQLLEKESEDLVALDELAKQWQKEKQEDPNTADFATYMAAEHSKVQLDLERALDAAGGKLTDSPQTRAFNRIDRAYRAGGWSSRKQPYSLNSRITRRSGEAALRRVDSPK